MDTEAEKKEEAPTEAKALVIKELLDVKGWKKDAKKICLTLAAIASIIIFTQVLRMPSWSLRFNSPVEVVKNISFDQSDSKFSFVFPERYVLDKNEEKKFGNDYLVGFHLEADGRTGCDARTSEVGINFSKNDEEISEAFSKELSAGVKGFDKFEGKRLKINGRDAFQSNFILTDPLGNSLKISQTLLSAGQENYLLVCGSGRAQSEFFAEDFEDFIQSFRVR